jgi:hypothetical protein
VFPRRYPHGPHAGRLKDRIRQALRQRLQEMIPFSCADLEDHPMDLAVIHGVADRVGSSGGSKIRFYLHVHRVMASGRPLFRSHSMMASELDSMKENAIQADFLSRPSVVWREKAFPGPLRRREERGRFQRSAGGPESGFQPPSCCKRNQAVQREILNSRAEPFIEPSRLSLQ